MDAVDWDELRQSAISAWNRRTLTPDTIGSHFGNGGGLDPVAGDGSLRKAVEGIGDDYMTSEKHHPGYVLIPTFKFEQIVKAAERAKEIVPPYYVNWHHDADKALAHPPHPAPVDPVAGGEALREAVRDALASELGDTYDCGRVWEAWSVGTMGEDDFTPVNDRVDEIADAILAALKGPAA